MVVQVATFYRFVDVTDPPALKDRLHALCRELGVTGTILIAREGINATVTASEDAIATLLEALRADPRFAGLEAKHANASAPPFARMKVKIKREIVTLGAPEARPSERTGTRVPPEAWDALIRQPGVTLIDTRNSYEVAIGTFAGALDPKTKSFGAFKAFAERHLDPARHRQIAMFCTGGIRCEKASAYLLANGFTEVYQLDGGILKYLEVVPAEHSQWLGECYVFDDRVAVTSGVREGTHVNCRACGMPVPRSATCTCQATVTRAPPAR